MYLKLTVSLAVGLRGIHLFWSRVHWNTWAFDLGCKPYKPTSLGMMNWVNRSITPSMDPGCPVILALGSSKVHRSLCRLGSLFMLVMRQACQWSAIGCSDKAWLMMTDLVRRVRLYRFCVTVLLAMMASLSTHVSFTQPF